MVTTPVIWTLGCVYFCAYSQLMFSFTTQQHEQHVHVVIDKQQASLMYVHAQM